MSTLAGTGRLIRLALRRDRFRIVVWIAGLIALVWANAASIKGLYPTQADLDARAEAVGDNVAFVALNGPARALDTLGGTITWEIGAFGLVIAALMSLLMVGRHTRGEEEAGRTELIRAAPVGRHAPTAAAMAVVAGMNVVVGVAVAAYLVGLDLPVAGSVALGCSFTAAGLVFAGVAAVAAQVSEHTRVVYGTAGAVLGASYALRAAGDVGDGTLSWLSPIGWVQAARPFAGERWWPLLLALGFSAAATGAAFFLASHRDVGAGLRRPRPGPAQAAATLTSPLGLAWRLQRTSLIGWAVGLLFAGLAYGSVGQEIEELLADNPDLDAVFAQGGGAGAVDVVDAYFSTILTLLALIGSGMALSSVLRSRSEESAGRAEPLLATAVSRWVWLGSQVAIALAGTVVVVAAGGLGAGLAHGLASGEVGQIGRLTLAALVRVPAVWILVGLGAVLFGLAPRAVGVVWAVLGGAVFVALFGQLLEVPAWLREASPFEHVPAVPAEDAAAGPLAALVVVAAVLVAAGLAGFRRRDVG